MTHYFFLFSLFAGLAWLWLTPGLSNVRRRVTVAAASGCCRSSPGRRSSRTRLQRTTRSCSPASRGRARARVCADPGAGVAEAQRTDPRVRADRHRRGGGIDPLFRRRGTAALCAALALTPLVCAGILSRAGFHILDFRNLIGCGPFVAVAFVAAIEAIPSPRSHVPLSPWRSCWPCAGSSSRREGHTTRSVADARALDRAVPNRRDSSVQDPLRQEGSLPRGVAHRPEWPRP